MPAMRRLVRSFLTILTGGCIASCSLAYDGSRHETGRKLCHDVGVASCEALDGCCGAPADLIAGCVATVERQCVESTELGALLTSTLTNLDPVEQERWLADVRRAASECDPDWLRLITIEHYLPRVFSGELAEGESCLDSSSLLGSTLSCSPPSVCTSTGGSPVCAGRKSVGERCFGFDCADGSFCGDRSDPRQCEMRRDLGQACTSHNECASFACDEATRRCVDSTDLSRIVCGG